jgi:SAP domain
MAVPTPLILDDVGIKISKDGTTLGLTALECSGNHIELAPDVSETTLDTFCGSLDYPGVTKWSLIATFYQSFDVDAVEEVLSAALALPAGKTLFEIVPYKSQAVSATNPRWSGEVIPQAYAPINGDAGDASTVEIEWSVVGAPVKSISPTALGAPVGSATDYEGMTVAELQAEAEARDLPTSGTKAELIERLSG